jgi:hypothetical protein
MSVSAILNATGKVPQHYLDLTANVATESLSLPAGSVATAIAVADDLRLAANKELEFAGEIVLVSNNNSALIVNSTAAVSAVAAGAATGTWLRIKLNGTFYKVALLADA